jgi:hypothetical protein
MAFETDQGKNQSSRTPHRLNQFEFTFFTKSSELNISGVYTIE